MAVSNGLAEPAACRLGEIGTLAESFLGRARESDGLHLGFDEVEPPKPERNFPGALHRLSFADALLLNGNSMADVISIPTGIQRSA
jgi:hypothetical protein